MSFHFLRPDVFWLVPGGLAVFLVLYRRGSAAARWRGVIAPHLLEHLIVRPDRRRRVRPLHLLGFGLLIGVLAAAGPSWRREPPAVPRNGGSAAAVGGRGTDPGRLGMVASKAVQGCSQRVDRASSQGRRGEEVFRGFSERGPKGRCRINRQGPDCLVGHPAGRWRACSPRGPRRFQRRFWAQGPDQGSGVRCLFRCSR